MKYSKPLIVIAVLLVAGAVGAAVLHPSWSNVKANTSDYTESFTANLTPEQEMASSTSTGSGSGVFNVTSDTNLISYSVTVSNLTSPISAAHLHCAPVGQTGQVIVPLMIASTTDTQTSATLSGSIMESDILPAAMSCNPNIKTLPQLIQAMREGQIYVNVHTQKYPMGEVRGQLTKSDQVIDFNSTATSTIATSTPVDTSTTTSTTSNNTSTDSTSSSNSTTTQTTSSPAGWDYVFVQPDAYYKIQGSTVTFSGSHFAPHETVTIMSGNTQIGTVVADASGDFTTGAFTVPYNLGQQAFSFLGNQSQLSFPVQISVGSGSPWIGLSSYYAPVGSTVTISGHQFGGNENVTLSWGGISVGTAHTDAQGNFSFTTTIPSTSSSQTTISATGVQTNLTTSQPFSLQQ